MSHKVHTKVTFIIHSILKTNKFNVHYRFSSFHFHFQTQRFNKNQGSSFHLILRTQEFETQEQ